MVKGMTLSKLVNELRHHVHSVNFEREFNAKTTHLTGPQRLQLKIKLNELAKPCTNIIDLRRKLKSTTAMYEFQGRVHYLDAQAQKLFTDGLKANKGVYTQDTYQRIMRYARDQQLQYSQQHAAAESGSNIGSFVLGRYYRRSEERMNFVIDITLRAGLAQSISAVTVDISLQGMQLKVPEALAVDHLLQQNVQINFIGLAREFVFDADKSYDYQVVGCHNKDGFNYLRLRRQATAAQDALDKLLKGLLSGYKFRYKVNVDHVIHSVRAKGHESHWLQSQQGLPVVFSADVRKRAYALATESNGTMVDSWVNAQPLLLNSLFNQRWVRMALAKLRAEQEQTRIQLAFYLLPLTVKAQRRYYAIPVQALAKQPALKQVVAEFRRKGYPVMSYILSVTYSALDKLFVGLMSEIEMPPRAQPRVASMNLDVLKPHRLLTQGVGATKLEDDHRRLVQLYTKCGLSNALFVHTNADRQRQINLAALVPFKKGLHGWFQKPDFWLSNSHNLLGGPKLQWAIFNQLKQLKPAQSEGRKTLLLRLSQSDDNQQPSISGRWLDDFTSFDEASLYINKLYREKKLLALNVELYRCKSPVMRPLKDDLNYVQTYLPHRAKQLEQQLKSIDSVIGLQDITAPLLRITLA